MLGRERPFVCVWRRVGQSVFECGCKYVILCTHLCIQLENDERIELIVEGNILIGLISVLKKVTVKKETKITT